MKAVGLVVSEKIFLCFSYCKALEANYPRAIVFPIISLEAPAAWPVWTPGALLAGFIRRITIHCYTQNMKALGLVVSEKKIFFYVFPHCKSMGAICCHGNHNFDTICLKT